MGLLFPHALNSEQERLRLPCLQKRTIEFNNGMLNGSRCSGDDPDCNYGEGGFFDAYGDCYYFYLIDIVVICSEETLQNRSSLLPCFGFQAYMQMQRMPSNANPTEGYSGLCRFQLQRLRLRPSPYSLDIRWIFISVNCGDNHPLAARLSKQRSNRGKLRYCGFARHPSPTSPQSSSMKRAA